MNKIYFLIHQNEWLLMEWGKKWESGCELMFLGKSAKEYGCKGMI